VLPALVARLQSATRTIGGSAEFIFVDDGSRDGSVEVLQNLATTEPRIGIVRFSRNFGKEQAMSAGLMAARGEAVVLLDADLQHPPEHIPEMVAAWRAGADLVNMKRRSRADESWSKRWAARMFYRLINALSDTPIPADIGDFRLLSRRAVDALNRLPERGRFMKGLFAWIGFPQVTIDYDVADRAAGSTKWSPRQLTRFAVEGITAFSIQPLKFAAKLGFLAAAIAVSLGLYYLMRTLVYGDPVPGFPTLIVVILMLGGVQLMAIGVLGEYLGRLWMESKQRPLFIIQDFHPPQWVMEDSAPTDAQP
jgi:glycosyltransferase involved in cell wall biosynthesis